MESVMDELLRQHRDAEAMLARLAAVVGHLRRERPASPDVLGELIELRREIQGEVLSHFREEEQALFPVLGRHLDSSAGPIAMLMEEHAEFRQLELQFEEALAALEAHFEGAWEERICEAGEAIGRLLPQHIEKEDGALFPMAETMLEEKEWEEIRRLWSAAQAAVPPA